MLRNIQQNVALKIVCLTLLIVALPAALGQTLVDASGQARAVIVVPDKADPAELFAGEELQRWLERLTGAILPLRENEGNSPYFTAVVYIGQKYAEQFKDDLEFLSDNDGYAVRSEKNKLWIFGSCPKGTLNGVYAFLEKNSDIIWARGKELGVIYSPMKGFKVTQANWRDKPVFSLRGWWICNTHYHEQTEYWNARLACNFNPCSFFNNDFIYQRSLDCGMQIDPGGGHNLHRFLPAAKYFETNPEYYCLIDGKRRPEVNKNQICFSNLDSVPAFVAEAAEQIKNSKYRVDNFSIKTEDNWNLCECDNCKKAILLADGSSIKPEDDSFRSTQVWIYFNEMAKQLGKIYPRLRINAYAYIFTAAPPAVKVADNVNVIFCPFVKNDKYSILHENNSKWKERIDAWAAASKNVVWREYYGCASNFPRPLADVAALDLRYINTELGLHQVYAEYIPDWNAKKNNSDNWDVSAMEFWVLSKLFWNPYQDVDKLRREYLRRAYRKAAPAMERYYSLIRRSWYEDPLPSVYNDDQYKNAAHYILEKGIAENCKTALLEAKKSADTDKVRGLVEAQLVRFEDWMEKAALQQRPQVVVPWNPAAGEASTPQHELWKQAGSVQALRIMGKPETASKYTTIIKLLHDRKNLYLLFDCQDNEPESLYAKPLNRENEAWPGGDHIEIFLDGDQSGKGYYQFAADCNGNIWDAQNFDNKWNSTWQVSCEKHAQGYWLLATVPLHDIGVNLSQGNKLRGLFYRAWHHGQDKHEHSSWAGGMVHQAAAFGDIILNME